MTTPKPLLNITFLLLGVVHFFAFARPIPAHAQDTSNPYLVGADEQIEESSQATKGLERPQDAPGFIATIYESDISERGYHTLADLLADVPGFWIESDERRDIAFTRMLQDSILIVYDGVPLVLDTGRSDVPIGNEISLLGVRQVEILRGPGTSLWGANAFNGVIYIRSKDATDIAHNRFVIEGGSDSRAGIAQEFSMRREGLSLYASARLLQERYPSRIFDNAPTRYILLSGNQGIPVSTTTAKGRADESHFGEALLRANVRSAHFIFRVSDFDSRTPLSTHSHSLLEAGRSEQRAGQTTTLLAGDQRRWGSTNVRLDGFILTRNRRDDSPLYRVDPASDHHAGGDIRVRADEIHYGIISQLDWERGPNTLSGGLQTSLNESHLATDYLDPVTGTLFSGAVRRKLRNVVASTFIQDRLLIGQTRLTAGVSYDNQNDFAPAFSPKGGVVQPLGKGWIGKLVYGEAIRTPDLYDVVGISGGAAAGDVVGIAANPDLDPEKIRTGELGAEYRRGTLGWMQFVLFGSEIVDLIERQTETGILQATNTGHRYTAGGEFGFGARLERALRLHGAYTVARLLDDDRDPLPAAPLHVGSLGLGYDLDDRLTAYTGLRGASRREARGESGEGNFGPYAVADLQFRFQPKTEGLIWTVGADNFLDTRYDHRNEAVPGRSVPVAIPGTPRRFFISVEGSF